MTTRSSQPPTPGAPDPAGWPGRVPARVPAAIRSVALGASLVAAAIWSAAPAAGGLAPIAQAGDWQPLPDLNEARQEVAAAHLGGALYVVGGFGAAGGTLASAERLPDGTAAWESLPPMPVAVNHPAAAAFEGRLYVFGGFHGPGLRNPVDAVQVFDPEAHAWFQGAAMPTVRGALAAAVLGEVVVVVGGARDGVSVAEVAAYHPRTDTWTVLDEMPTPRDHLGAAVVDGLLYVIGGRAGRDLTMGANEVFDPVAGAWRAAATMPTGRSGHAVAAHEGCVYALGGEGNPSVADGMFQQVERYHPGTDTWEELPHMRLPRHGMGAVPVGGRLLVPGGATVAGFGATAAADAFTPPPCGPPAGA